MSLPLHTQFHFTFFRLRQSILKFPEWSSLIQSLKREVETGNLTTTERHCQLSLPQVLLNETRPILQDLTES